jgi:hypothetical protein
MTTIGFCVIATGVIIDAIVGETECCPKGGQFGAGLAILLFTYINWITNIRQ